MAEKKDAIPSGVFRIVYYLLTAVCFFFIFLLAVTLSPNRIDAQLTLTLIIAVLLLIFMLHTSQLLGAIYRRLEDMTKQLERTG